MNLSSLYVSVDIFWGYEQYTVDIVSTNTTTFYDMMLDKQSYVQLVYHNGEWEIKCLPGATRKTKIPPESGKCSKTCNMKKYIF